MTSPDLIKKYTVQVPRYTSYPTVPYWDTTEFDTAKWLESVKLSFAQSNQKDGISLYVHLPYCENLCTYCACNKRITKNHKVEIPYIQAVIKEWALYKEHFDTKPQIKEIHLGGGTPTFFDPQNLKMLIDGLLENCIIHPQAEFSFEAHPSNTTREHLEVLHALGFKRLSLGIQDFDPKVQFIINRMQSFEKVKQVFQSTANQFYGITGPLLLNAAGDRSIGTFDYWGIVNQNGTYTWKWVGRSG